MKVSGRLAVCAIVAAFVALAASPGRATPLADVPRERWAADAIASLAHDGVIAGYPNLSLGGDRELTRYQAAALVARGVAKVEADGASLDDLEKLAKLVDLYKDQLESMGVRLATVEDKFAALDHATQFAQRFSIHGTLYSQYAQGENVVNPSISVGGPLARTDPIQKFTDAYIETDASNHPYYGSELPGVFLPRSFWELTPQYAVDPNLVVSMPVKIWDYHVGGYRQQGLGFGISPTLELSIAKIRQLTSLDIRVGTLENIRGSLTGLTYLPPDNFHFADKDPFRPFPQGINVTATAFGDFDFQLFGAHIDRVGVNTGPFGPNTGYGQNQYLGPYWFPPSTNVYSSAPTTDAFSAGTSALPTAYLSLNAQPGTIFVSFYRGPPACLAGCFFTGPAQPNEPNFSYVQSGNAVVFASPLSPGSQVSLSYTGFSVSNDTLPQRYDVGGRFVYRIPGIASAQVGLTFNRIFDIGGNGSEAPYFQNSAIPSTLVSDTVFGFDVVFPLAYQWGAVKAPALFAETSTSRFTRDAANVPYVTDHASIVGLRFKLFGGNQSLSYLNVGPNFISGAPFEWSRQPPVLFAFSGAPQLPGAFGIGNDATLNESVDALATSRGYAGPLLSQNPLYPYGTFAFPLFNQFHAEGPYYYSAYAPNTRGAQVQLNLPLNVGGTPVKLRLGAQSLEELQPNSLAAEIFGPGFVSKVRQRFTSLGGGVTVSLPAFSRTATVSLDALREHLLRDDTTPFLYAADPALGTSAFNPAASAELTGTGQSVTFYPNYQNVVHTVGAMQASVPINSALTANIMYVGQRYSGEALNSLTQSISEKKTMFTGGVLYNIPKTNSSIDVYFARYSYRDYVLPSYDWAQNRQNVYFTVKF